MTFVYRPLRRSPSTVRKPINYPRIPGDFFESNRLVLFFAARRLLLWGVRSLALFLPLKQRLIESELAGGETGFTGDQFAFGPRPRVIFYWAGSNCRSNVVSLLFCLYGTLWREDRSTPNSRPGRYTQGEWMRDGCRGARP